MSTFPPLNHVAVTVRDLSVSTRWYTTLLGAEPIADEDSGDGFHHAVWALPNGTLFGVHVHTQPATVEQFSEFNVGLDHIAFGCESREELEKWAARLTELGIEHSEIVDRPYGSGLSFRDPDGIPLEFFSPPTG
jgi:catechol 2,3-dioxygenase-like lactoylglutathione lyase family enzyme